MPDSLERITFPWREGNTVRFHIDGHRFFPAMLESIELADNFILMEMYLFESGEIGDQFVKAFSYAAKRGVTVQLLVDDFGARGLSFLDRKKMLDAGVELDFYNPLLFKKYKKNLARTHRKYLIIDGIKAFVGGAGITDYFHGQNAWRETMAEIQGTVVADWHRLFKQNITHWFDSVVPEIAESVESNNGIRAKLSYTSGGERHEILKALLNRMNTSQEYIWLASAYFIPSRKIRKALRKSALKGKDVRLLLPGPVTDHPSVRYASRRYYARLLRFGVRIFEYQGRFTHTKMILVDDWLTIGSSNVDRWNFRWNLEANLEIESKESTHQAREILLDDFENSEEIIYSDWVTRSKMQRVKEWLWGKVDIWLTTYI